MYKVIFFYIIAIIIFVVNNFNVCENFNFHNDELYNELANHSKKFQLAEWEFLKTRDPFTNQLPPNIKSRERIFIQKNDRTYFNKNSQFQSDFWINIGPYNIAGRIKEIEFDVINHNNMVAASASGGIWYSTNRGNSWFKSFQPEFEQSIYCLEQDKRNGKSHIWYAGTGELLSTTDRKFANQARTIGLGDGIYKSTDNGLSWFKLESTNTYNNTNISEPFQMIWDIKVDKFTLNEDVIFAACYGSILKSTDSGNSWSISIGNENNTSLSTDIEISESGTYYAALSSFSPTGVKPEITGIWRSKDGTNWVDITPQNFPDDTRIIKIKSSKSNPNVVYVFTESPRKANDPFYDFATSRHTLWKYTYDSINEKGVWEDRTENLPYQNNDNINQTLQQGINSLGGYCIDIAVSPNDENVVYISGTNLFVSEDGFATKSYRKIGGYNSRLHPDIHYVNFLPNNSDEIFVATDGGVFYTNNKSASPVDWMELNDSLVTSQIYSIGIPEELNNLAVVAGLQDQGSILTNENFNRYYQVLGGDGLSCYMSKNADFIIVSSYNSYIVGLALDNFYISSSRVLVTKEILNKTTNFFTVFDVEPNNENLLYLGVNNSIYKLENLKEVINNENAKLNWSEIKIPDIDSEAKISFIKAVPTPSDRLLVGTSNGKIFIIDNASQTPIISDITSDNLPENAFVSSIAIDKYNPLHLYLTFSNYNIQSIFQTTDGGATWIPQGGNLEENPDGTGAGPSIRWIEVVNNGNEKLYFTGTTSGLYYTNNLAGIKTIWRKISSDKIGNIRIDQIKYREKDDKLIVATQGNGIYYTDLLLNIDRVTIPLKSQITIYPNPAYSTVNIKTKIIEKGNYELTLMNNIGKSYRKGIFYLNVGLNYLNFDISDLPAGTYFLELTNKKASYIRKVIKK